CLRPANLIWLPHWSAGHPVPAGNSAVAPSCASNGPHRTLSRLKAAS
ncbi:MAG: hypothetical protein, partial [Olavius algarvensis Delta 4 endosymbiont]